MRRVAATVVVIALLAAACGGGKDKKEAKVGNTPTTASADTSATNATGSGEGATAATAKPGTGGTSATTAKSGAQKGTATTARANGGGSTANGSTATAGSAGAAPGTYTYDRTGDSSTTVFGDKPVNDKVTLTMDPVANGEQHSTTSAEEGTSEQTLRFLTEGAYFTDLKQSTSGFNKEFKPNPPVLAFPATPTVGRSWSWTITSTDGKTTLNASLRIDRNETVTIGGEQVQTVVMAVTLHATGDIEFTSNATDWVSQSKALIVKSQTTTDGTVSGVQFHQQATQVLESTKPQ